MDLTIWEKGMKDKTKRISKFLSYVLRHNPGEIGLSLDKNGWVSISQLIENARLNGKLLTIDLIKEIVDTNDKKRFSISEDGKSIRANQGHSIKVDLALAVVEPPVKLLHGTAEKNLGLILSEGLLKMNRHHVHLTESRVIASKVGTRYGKLVLLEVDSIQMHRDGYEFFCTDNKVWLVDSVPAKYINIIR